MPESHEDTIVELRDLHKSFSSLGRAGRRTVNAVDGVSLAVPRGSSYGLVGESGCGKTTLARLLIGLERASAGEILLDGHAVPSTRSRETHRRIQMVFQDPFTSLNPRKRIGATLIEAMGIHGIGSRSERRDRAIQTLELVGFTAASAVKFPHEFSGGQRQRIGIARALITEPDLLVCDEPVSALDVSIQAQILNLLQRLKRDLHLSMIFISHDLGVVRHVSDTVGVMRNGQIVEEAPVAQLFSAPQHPYTRVLLDSIPRIPEHPHIGVS